MAAVIIHSDFGAQENKICLTSTFSLSICHEVMGLNAKILVLFSFFFFNIEIILLLVTKKKRKKIPISAYTCFMKIKFLDLICPGWFILVIFM